MARHLGFGCGGIWGDPLFSEAKAERAFRAACEHGISFFDTGSAYSRGNAEVRLGKFLKRSTDEVEIATKVGTKYSGRRYHKDFGISNIRRSIDESCRKLGVDHISLVQLHGLPAMEELEPAIECLLSIKRKGTIGAIGVSCDGESLKKAVNEPRFDCVMATFNVLERSNEPHLRIAKSCGKRVLVKSPMAHRAYSNSIFALNSLPRFWYLIRLIKNKPKLVLRGLKYRYLTHESALSFVVSRDFVDCTVIGSTRSENVVSCVETSKKPFKPELAEKIYATQ